MKCVSCGAQNSSDGLSFVCEYCGAQNVTQSYFDNKSQDSIDESKDFYERSKIDYENKLDGTPEEYSLLYNTMSQNYDRMIANQESRNNSLYLLGSLYAFNSIELLKIRFWN